jgi:two-component system response regulator VicR
MPDMADVKKHILVVEDEKEIMKALKLKLEKEGYTVTCCYDGQQAIDAMKEQQFDYVLLDIIMPVKDGFSVLQERAGGKNATTPISVLTALGQEDNLMKAKQLGAKQCYVKSNTSIGEILQHIKDDLSAA